VSYASDSTAHVSLHFFTISQRASIYFRALNSYYPFFNKRYEHTPLILTTALTKLTPLLKLQPIQVETCTCIILT
jgi:hypothetical protein